MSQRVTPAARRPLLGLPLLLLPAWPLAAQAQRAHLFDSFPPATVALPAAVRVAYRQLPTQVTDAAATWVAYPPGQGAATRDTLFEASYEVVHLVPLLTDTLRYYALATFSPSGRVRNSTRELPVDSLPWRIRRRLRQSTRVVQKASPNAQPCLAVVFLNPYQRRPRYRAHYTLLFYDPTETDTSPFAQYYEFWRNGRPVKQPHFR